MRYVWNVRAMEGLLAGVLLATAACSSGHQSAEAPRNTTSTAGPTPTSTVAKPAARPVALSGIVVGSGSSVGMIDPVTGTYSTFAAFKGSHGTHSGTEYAVDYKRLATSIKFDDGFHPGWIDTNGDTLDLTPPVAKPGPFDTPKTYSYGAGSFDGHGDFYFVRNEFHGAGAHDDNYPDAVDLFRVKNGSVTAEVVKHSDNRGSNEFRGITRYRSPGLLARGYDGALLYEGVGKAMPGINQTDYRSSCGYGHIDWISPNEIVTANGSMGADKNGSGTNIYGVIVKSTDSEFDDANAGGMVCGDSSKRELLPTTNESSVSSPVVSPDKKRIAFLRGGSELWIVNADGQGQPVRVPVSGINLDKDSTLLSWR